ncbi:hypothetical protein HDE_01662 [Halotydeus destructor]|nr:hypothetical protein HDE_01662 [Halotydeus destructor]
MFNSTAMKLSAVLATLALIGACSAKIQSGPMWDLPPTNTTWYRDLMEAARQHVRTLVDSDFEPKVTKILSSQKEFFSTLCHLKFEISDTVCKKIAKKPQIFPLAILMRRPRPAHALSSFNLHVLPIK